jgi:hypothetical protein
MQSDSYKKYITNNLILRCALTVMRVLISFPVNIHKYAR